MRSWRWENPTVNHRTIDCGLYLPAWIPKLFFLDALTPAPYNFSMISQRSVGRLQRLLNTLMYRPPQTLPLLSWSEYRTQLYEEGVDRHVVNHIESEYHKQPKDFLPAIHDGTIPAWVYRNDGYGQPVPNHEDIVLGQALLKVFSEVALRHGLSMPPHLPEVKAVAAELKASLEIDGYELVSGRLVPATMKGISLQQEDDYLIHLIKSIKPANLDVILHHHGEADETFVNGNWGSTAAETRNFFVALLRGLRDVASERGGLPQFAHGNDSALIEDFRNRGLLTAEEKEVILKLWVLLSYSGPHVGIQDDARARLTRLLILGQAQWLCLKFIAWENNGFRPL